MNRYNVDMGIEGQYEPGSHGRVLRNLLGITSKREMYQLEYDHLKRVIQEFLPRIDTEMTFTADFIKEMHHAWLGGIYAWAGQYRTVEVSKSGFTWPPAFRVAENMQHFESAVLRRFTPCKSRDVLTATAAMAQVQAEFLLVHPFREGNGRIARWLTDSLSMQAGFHGVAYAFTGRGGPSRRKQYLQAVIQGYQQNYDPLAGLLAVGLERRLRRLG